MFLKSFTKKSVFVFLLLLTNNILCQKLTIKELTSLCSKLNWEDVNQTLFSKNWVFYDSKNEDNNIAKITWSYNIDYNSEKATGWFNLYFSDNQTEKVEYTFYDKEQYKNLINSIPKSGFTKSNNYIFNQEVISRYENSSYYLYISTSKKETDDIYNQSIIVYTLVIIKKKEIEKTTTKTEYEYYENGQLKLIYDLEYGQLNGNYYSYYENGESKLLGQYKNNKENGVFYLYNEEGILVNEFNMINGSKNGYYYEYDYYGNIKISGQYKNNLKNGSFKQFFDNGEIEIENQYENDLLNGIEKSYHYNKNIKSICNYKNGKIFGTYKEYDEQGKLIIELVFENGIKNGKYTEFKYNDNEILVKKIIGNYLNDKKHGKWEEYDYLNENNPVLISSIFFEEDLKNGQCLEFYYNNKILSNKIIGSYLKDKKEGIWEEFNYLSNNFPLLISRVKYSNDKKNGAFKKIKNDTLYVGNFSNDLLNGDFKVFVNSEDKLLNIDDSIKINLIASGNFTNSLKNGEWNYYYPIYKDENNNITNFSKKLYLTENYYKGLLNGLSTKYSFLINYKKLCFEDEKSDSCLYYNCFKIRESQNFNNGQLNGLYELRDSLNEILISGNFSNNLKNGLWIIKEDFGYNKKIINSGNYKNGLKDGIWLNYFYENKILESSNYSNGKLNGLTKKYNHFNNTVVEENFKNDTINVIEKKSIIENELYEKYEFFYSDESGFYCKKTIFLKNDSSIITNYWFKNIFLINLSILEFEINKIDSIELIENGYKNGEFIIHSKNKPFVHGFYEKNLKEGSWKYYYYDQEVIYLQNYKTDNLISELYFDFDNNLFFGTFEKINNEKKTIEYIKIKNGLRNGVSKTYDLFTKKLILKEKYVNGVKDM